MIVRILGEGQFVVDSDFAVTLNELDQALDTDLESAEPTEFPDHLAAMQEFVRTHGQPLPLEDLRPSDAVLPAAGSTLDEVRALLTDEGLIPG